MPTRRQVERLQRRARHSQSSSPLSLESRPNSTSAQVVTDCSANMEMIHTLNDSNCLECSRCSFRGNDYESIQIHTGTIHPEVCDEIDAAGLGNLIFYQKSAKLFHCFKCFFTSKMFSNVYYHITARHAMPDKSTTESKDSLPEKMEHNDNTEPSDKLAESSEDEKSVGEGNEPGEKEQMLVCMKSEENVMSPLKDEIKPKEEESSDADSNFFPFEKQSMNTEEAKDKISTSDEEPLYFESSDNSNTYPAMNKASSSSAQMQHIPEFSDDEENPPLPKEIMEFSDHEETVPLPKEIMEFSDNEETVPLPKEIIEFSDHEETVPLPKEIMEFSDHEETVPLPKEIMEFSVNEEIVPLPKEIVDFSVNEETSAVAKKTMDFLDIEEMPAPLNEMMEFSDDEEASALPKDIMEFSDNEDAPAQSRPADISDNEESLRKDRPEFSDVEETQSQSKDAHDFSDEEETPVVSKDIAEFSDEEETTVVSKNMPEFSDEEEAPLSKGLPEYSGDEENTAESKGMPEFSDDDYTTPLPDMPQFSDNDDTSRSKDLPEFSDNEDTSTRSKDLMDFSDSEELPSSKGIEFSDNEENSQPKETMIFSDIKESSVQAKDVLPYSDSEDTPARPKGIMEFSDDEETTAFSKDILKFSEDSISPSTPTRPDDAPEFIDSLNGLESINNMLANTHGDMTPMKANDIFTDQGTGSLELQTPLRSKDLIEFSEEDTPVKSDDPLKSPENMTPGESKDASESDDKEALNQEDAMLKYLRRAKGKYYCLMCESRPMRKGAVLHHLVGKHNIPSPYQCKECGKSFVLENVYKNHLSSHTEGLYKCPRCSFETNHPRGFKKHQTHCQSRHSDEANPKPFELQQNELENAEEIAKDDTEESMDDSFLSTNS